MRNEHRVLGRGAEATVYRTVYLGRDAVVKTRIPKGYRHPELDLKLRSSRTKHEAKVMIEARRAGVRTPVIYDIDVKKCDITMEYIIGRKIKDVLDAEPSKAKELCKEIGKTVAKLHNVGISHGDLTTSNMILMPDGEICIFDLSLGTATAELEDLGVDIHLLQRAFTSAHSGLDEELKALMDSYSKNMKNSKSVLKRVDDIRGRARYT